MMHFDKSIDMLNELEIESYKTKNSISVMRWGIFLQKI